MHTGITPEIWHSKTATKSHSILYPGVGLLLIRYGGDEFAAGLTRHSGRFLQIKLEQIHTAAQMASVPGYSHFRISLSIGGTIQTIADPMEKH